jgi:hypothetical protein
MDKPPTKAKPSAEPEDAPEELDAEAQDRSARLLQLAGDYLAAFYRDPTEENLQTAQLLIGISGSPDLRRKLANEERQLANKEAGTHHTFWNKVWVRLVPPLVAYCKGDPDATARDLIAHVPAPLRVRCPDYPTTPGETEAAVAAVVAARNFKPELAMWRACGDVDALKVARAVLRGLGMPKDQAKSLFSVKTMGQ